ncbi:hypothetical protein, partial [Kitasatospora sp. NPDC088779]|uniref:hypothetical protein n=1 Tax=Kitasatospora sp. NPDC088779 TaxID=3154964 RepID=UPI0034330467
MATNNTSGRPSRKRAASKAGGAFSALNNLSQSGQLAAINNTPTPPPNETTPAPSTIPRPTSADQVPAP